MCIPMHKPPVYFGRMVLRLFSVLSLCVIRVCTSTTKITSFVRLRALPSIIQILRVAALTLEAASSHSSPTAEENEQSSSVAQRKNVGQTTQRSIDRNDALLNSPSLSVELLIIVPLNIRLLLFSRSKTDTERILLVLNLWFKELLKVIYEVTWPQMECL